MEQLANFESRLGVRLAAAKGAGDEQRARGAERIEMAISRLTTLGHLGNTSERLALLAGCYKNLAQIRSDREERSVSHWNRARGTTRPRTR